MGAGQPEVHSRINVHGEDIAVLKTEVRQIKDQQKNLENLREQDRKDVAKRHDELLDAITANRLATSVIKGKWSAGVAVVLVLVTIAGAVMGWLETIKEWAFK